MRRGLLVVYKMLKAVDKRRIDKIGTVNLITNSHKRTVGIHVDRTFIACRLRSKS